MATELKETPVGALIFTANGKDYIVESRLSLERFKWLQRFEIELMFGVSGVELFQRIKKAFLLLDDAKVAKAAVALHDLMDTVSMIEKHQVPAYRICALFINTANEDRTKISEELIAQKIDDWNTEGIPADFFLRTAKTISLGYTESLDEDTPHISP